MTEDEVVGWHCQFDGHDFEQAPGVGDGQGRQACSSPLGHKEWAIPPDRINTWFCPVSSFYPCDEHKLGLDFSCGFITLLVRFISHFRFPLCEMPIFLLQCFSPNRWHPLYGLDINLLQLHGLQIFKKC